jgi:hypothetical protein
VFFVKIYWFWVFVLENVVKCCRLRYFVCWRGIDPPKSQEDEGDTVLRRIVLFSVVAAVVAAMVVAAPAMAQQAGIVEGPEAKVEDGKASAKVSEDVWAKSDPCPEAQAGGAKAKAGCPPPKPPPPKPAPAPAPPPPKAAPPPPPKPEEKKALPPTGGVGSASLLALGAGALLVGGGLLARRFVR